MKRPPWQRWAVGIAAGAVVTVVAGLLFGYFGLEVRRGVLGYVIPITVCIIAGSIALKIAGC